MAHVLIIEDEPDLLQTWAYYLEQAGHTVTAVMDGATGQDLARNASPDLIILDLHLVHNQEREPVRGMDILRELRTVSNVPVLIATGNFTDQLDRVLGFRLGADDYLIKGNFGVQELIARVEYQLARHRGNRREAEPHAVERDDSVLAAGDLKLDRDRQTVTRAGRPIDLSPLEFKVLLCLMLNRRRNTTFVAIWRHCWGDSPADMASIRNNIRIQVSGIRRKLNDTRAANPLIVSIRGVGYCFRG